MPGRGYCLSLGLDHMGWAGTVEGKEGVPVVW